MEGSCVSVGQPFFRELVNHPKDDSQNFFCVKQTLVCQSNFEELKLKRRFITRTVHCRQRINPVEFFENLIKTSGALCPHKFINVVHTLFLLSFVVKRVLLNNQQRVVVHNVVGQNHLVLISFKGKFVKNLRFALFRKGAFGVSRKVLVAQVLILNHAKTFGNPLSQLGQIICSFHLDHNF